MTDILIVDDEKRMGTLLREELEEAGWTVDVETSGAGALARLQQHAYGLVITDLRMTPPDGLAILRHVKEHSPATDVVVMTAYASTQTAIEAMKSGAYDYVAKPFDMEDVRLLVQRVFERRRLAQEREQLSLENAALRDRLAGGRRSPLVGESAALQELRRLIELVAASDATVLIRGPSGTGKELVASEVHARSRRAAMPFVAVNCAAIPETLLEGELFGYEKGAFTGAEARKPGRFELAQGGTIFLDEIGEMPAGVQAKLLRVLEERKVHRLGGVAPIEVDLRVVAATNRDLEAEIRAGRFREDLFYRLQVFPIEVPPLARHREDVPTLAEFFLRELRYPHTALEASVAALLYAYEWPGNVRELRNALERATILARGAPLEPAHFALPRAGSPATVSLAMELPDAGIDLEQLEAHLIRQALRRAGGNKSQAARLLGMTRRTLYSRMEKHGIRA